MSLPYPTLTAEEAAALISNGDTIGFSGFTPAGTPKAVPRAIAARARELHAAGHEFKIGVLTGASTGASIDGALAEADAISFRTPYQSNSKVRAAINAGKIRFVDMHLSMLPQAVRYGFLGKVNWAIVEACDISSGGGIVLTSGVGAAPTYLREADKIIIELNASHPATLLGLHDIFEPADPPVRQEIPIYHASDRIGSPIAVVDPSKIVGIVHTNEDEETKEFSQPTATTEKIGQNVAEFLSSELRAGRIPKSFLPLQSGVGDVANSVLAALGADTSVPPFEMYTEVLQNSVVPLLESGRCKFASTCSLTVSPEAMKHIADNIEFFKKHVVLRPQELSNNPEVVRRLGVVSMNTAIEFDLGGNVNSTHVMGNMMMNGIGGSGDFTRAAYMSIFSCASTAKGGKISTVVPLASHIDHTEHSVSVVITEQGIADLRGKDPHERARLIIENCAHPDFKDDLRKYLHLTKQGHVPQSMTLAFAMHRQFLNTGDMHHADWDNQTK